MLETLPCAPLRSAFFRDAAGSPYERSLGVTRVLRKFRDRGQESLGAVCMSIYTLLFFN